MKASQQRDTQLVSAGCLWANSSMHSCSLGSLHSVGIRHRYVAYKALADTGLVALVDFYIAKFESGHCQVGNLKLCHCWSNVLLGDAVGAVTDQLKQSPQRT